MNIYLIGMPGCGKSSVGKKLAHKLKYNFIDIDKYIEKKLEMPISQVFDKYGEDYFRKLEKSTLTEFMNSNNYVISCGGGIVLDSSNKQLMNGKVILITVKLETIKARVLGDNLYKRPLLKTKSVKQIFIERKAKYEFFKDIKVYNHSVNHSVNAILKELNYENNSSN
ncbi:MAG: shikimate kinase [Anaeroplasmataceae bacterium]